MKTKDITSSGYSEAGKKMHGFIIATGVCAVDEASICNCIESLQMYQVSRLRGFDENRKPGGILNGGDAFANIIMIALLGVLFLALWSMRDAVAPLVW